MKFVSGKLRNPEIYLPASIYFPFLTLDFAIDLNHFQSILNSARLILLSNNETI